MMGSTLPLQRIVRGKVRDVYEVDSERLLLLTTDRISAFDVVMRDAIPHKGVVLTQLTSWWLRRLEGLVEHHLLSAHVEEIIAEVPSLAAHRDEVAGRAMLCRRTRVFPVECVIRGYLSGSAWKEYRETGTLAGEPLPAGLLESDRLVPPVFSPATKATAGHDENITVRRMAELVGGEVTASLEQLTRRMYEQGRAVAAERGIVIADTKFEFGQASDGRLLLVDEVLTPDSSRFWPAAEYRPGGPQPSFDKQPLRDYLDGERRAGRWTGEAPGPSLPPEVVHATSARYLEAYRRLTGATLDLTGLT